MNRRELLTTITAFLASGTALPAGVKTETPSIVSLGHIVLQARVVEQTVPALSRALGLSDLIGANDLTKLDLSQRISEDYRRGETIRVKRWSLSRSEARLYALAALTYSSTEHEGPLS